MRILDRPAIMLLLGLGLVGAGCGDEVELSSSATVCAAAPGLQVSPPDYYIEASPAPALVAGEPAEITVWFSDCAPSCTGDTDLGCKAELDGRAPLRRQAPDEPQHPTCTAVRAARSSESSPPEARTPLT